MFKRILIANRGEIALRVIRACREMDIATVAVYSDADRVARHTLFADEAYPIGPGPSSESYLVFDKIIGAAKQAGAASRATPPCTCSTWTKRMTRKRRKRSSMTSWVMPSRPTARR